MELKDIITLIETIEKGSLSRFEYVQKDFKLLLEKQGQINTVAVNQEISQTAVVGTQIETTEKEEGSAIKSPLVGTYYSKASPESEPFVQVGDRVKKGDTVCIVEAMKLFNEVQSDFDGVVKKILLEDGEVVSFDQPLFVLE